MSRIQRVAGREVLDSRGNPTVEAEVELSSGAAGRGIDLSRLDAPGRRALWDEAPKSGADRPDRA